MTGPKFILSFKIHIYFLGHGTLNESTVPQVNAYNLTEQIEHKIAFLEEFFPSDCQFILIGHSIGAYIILKLLEHYGERQEKITKGILLFPTIERMAISPNGRFATPVSNYLSWPVVAMSWGLSLLPLAMKKWLVSWWFKERNIHEDSICAVLELITANSMRNMLYMAADEMEKVDKTPTKVSHFYYVKLYVIFFTCQAPIHPATVICIGNHMIASTIKDLHYE